MAFYRGVFQRLMETEEMADFIQRGAFTKAWLTGPEFVRWLEQKDATVRRLMRQGGLSAP
jgi:tripartite-type tricarboxylate transporter receptor subunit TctC